MSLANLGLGAIIAFIEVQEPMPPAHRDAIWAHAADAADTMALPRTRERESHSPEVNYVHLMRMLIDADYFTSTSVLQSRLAAASARLMDSWQRLERSGVLRRRGIDRAMEKVERVEEKIRNAARAAAAAPGLRSCGLAGCGAREAHPQHFKSCGACRIPAYCCKEHQSVDWPSHKAACKAARKAAAAADADGAGPSGA